MDGRMGNAPPPHARPRLVHRQARASGRGAFLRRRHVVDTSDRHYGEPRNMLMPYRAANMGDGWETRRRRGPGHDWAVVRLGVAGLVRRIDIDTAHFKANYPDAASVDAAILLDDQHGVSADTATRGIADWKVV